MKKHPLFWLPNLMTVIRCGLSVVVAWIILLIAQKEASLIDVISSPGVGRDTIELHRGMIGDFRMFWGSLGFMVFVLAAITDFLDGYLARLWNVESRFGRLLDPIADKLSVGLPLLAIAAVSGWAAPLTAPVLVIIFRDVLITCLRFVGLGAGRMAVRFMAKLKTFLEMILIAAFLLLLAYVSSSDPNIGNYLTLWMIGLWGVAVISLYTGLVYVSGLFRKPPKTDPPVSAEP